MQLDFESLKTLYKHGAATPSEVVAEVYDRIAASTEPVWISTVPREKALARARRLEQTPLANARPLYGIPFAIKDNIDLACLPTTGCFNGLVLMPTNVHTPVEESCVHGARRWGCKDKVAIIDVEGMLMNARGSGFFGSGENPVAQFRERLEKAAQDPRVKAVVRSGLDQLSSVLARLEAAVGRGAVVDIVAQRE